MRLSLAYTHIYYFTIVLGHGWVFEGGGGKRNVNGI